MKPILFLMAALLLAPTTGCSKNSNKAGKDKERAEKPAARTPENACRPFCQRLEHCADTVSDALVSDLPEAPRKLFKGKLMARYKNPARCVSDCERAERANPGPGSAVARCKDSKDCQALADCLHTMVMERRKKITSVQKDHELKVKGARKASRLPHQPGARKPRKQAAAMAPEQKAAAR